MKYNFLIFILFSNLIYSQIIENEYINWNSQRKLTIEDYKIKINDPKQDIIFSQFVISHTINGLDFLKKNFNQKIENKFLGSASWINISNKENIEKVIDFQQTQFDISEIQTRKFRKRLLYEKKKLLYGLDFVNVINNDIMKEFSEIRLLFMKETESGRNEKKLEEWKEKVKIKLKQLEEFSFENKDKIKIKIKMKLSNKKKIIYIIVGIITFLAVNFFLNFEKNYKEMKKGFKDGMENK